MAQNYTKMWDAFLGGEYEGYDASKDYLEQTKDFYKTVLAPAFDLPGFGETDLAGAYAQFSEVDFETAERDFRSAIGDPYGTDDPFSWEKVSRYNTGDPAGVGRLQDLLEDQLYGQGKFLGGEAGADYGTATSKEVETYSTGMRGESEALTHEGLTSGASLASGTSGATIRSGASMGVAEDVLIEAYKKAKTLGTEYRAGSELIEQTLEGDLNEALTTYLDAIDDEKERWFSSVMGNVQTFKTLEMEDDLGECDGDDECPEGATCRSGYCQVDYQTMTDEELETEVGSEFYKNWSCGYGQEWSESEGMCVDTATYTAGVAAAKFSSDPACGIGELRNETTGVCEVRDDLGLEADDYGYLCDEGEIDECGDCLGNNEACADECGVPNGPGLSESCWDGSMACPGACPEDTRVEDCAGELGGSAEEDECGVCDGDGPSVLCGNGSMACSEAECPTLEEGQCWSMADCPPNHRCDAGYCLEDPKDECGEYHGDGPSELCWDQTLVCDLSECSTDPATIPDECGVAGGGGPQHNCLGGEIVCDESECPDTSFTDDDEEYVNCEEGFGWNSQTQKCEWEGTSGWQWDSSNCNRPENSCPDGQECGMNGVCFTPRKKPPRRGKGRKKRKIGGRGKGYELIGGR